MRIRHHVSTLHIVAIVGTVSLALAFGWFMSTAQSLADDSAIAARRWEQIKSLRIQAGQLRDMLGAFGPNLPPRALGSLDRSIKQWHQVLTTLRADLPLANRHYADRAIQALEPLITQRWVTSQSGSSRSNIDVADQVSGTVQSYTQTLENLQDAAARRIQVGQKLATRHRRLAMIMIGLLGIVYLAVIEHTRHWTTRRLVRPIEELAEVAIQAVGGDESIPDLEHCGTEELNTLAEMLSGLVQALREKVQERTAQLERQKEHLEREMVIRRRAENQLWHIAFHDRLTNLCNRELLMDRLDRCIQRADRASAYRFAVLFLDVDRFKEVNDSLGHTVGDQLLIAIAKRLQGCLRNTDALGRTDSNTIARIGGDEFVVLLDGIRMESDAIVVAQRLQQSLAEPFKLGEQEVFTTASIGIASNKFSYNSPDHLLRDADAAMYHAKASGKARHEVFTQQMHAEAVARLQLSNDLRRAVESDEFLVHYQPIVSLSTGRLTGFEALLRWDHPQRGMVPPCQFIRHAEEMGLIVTLGERALREACGQLAAWRQELDVDPALSVSVNVSKRQVAEPGLVDLVQCVLQETGLSAANLKLEITESVIMANVDSIAKVLEQFKQLGVHVHMDDFGTGYSSLSYLHRFPLDLLKIDRHFMGTMTGSQQCTNVIHTVVVLAHNLNMEVTVEGIETHRQLKRLVSVGCDYAQGYYFSPPVDAETAKQMISLSSWRHPPTTSRDLALSRLRK